MIERTDATEILGGDAQASPDEEVPMALSAVAPAWRQVSSQNQVLPAGDADASLVEAAQAGDQAAFAKLFERHHSRVYAMCSRLLRDRAEVEDAVQHAFLEAWRCLERFEGRSRFSTWITRIAIHTCFGFRRRLKRLWVTEEIPEKVEQNVLGWGPTPQAPDEGAVHSARKAAVSEVLAKLSAKKRVVFVLSELEGMTAPEISEVLDIPEATVRTRLFHARRELSQKFRSHPGFADLFADGNRGGGA